MHSFRAVLLEGDCPLSSEACALLEAAGATLLHTEKTDSESLAPLCREADAVLTFLTEVRAPVLQAMERCKIVVRLGVGYDSIDYETARRHGIAVSNIPDYCTEEVADHALALALSLFRELPFLHDTLRHERWNPRLPYPMPPCDESVFGLIGLGRIGRAAAARARAFGFRLLAHDPYASEATFSDCGATSASLEEVLETADILSLHTPLTPETFHILNVARLRLMKPTAIVVNTARGKCIDTVALAKALEEGHLGAAGIDVFEEEPLPKEHPLRHAPRVLLTPHWAWHSARSQRKLHRMGVEEALRGVREEPLRSCVNR
jgi:D-3-phosphoglycerate dehydrogenase